jgi:hypothetical protein
MPYRYHQIRPRFLRAIQHWLQTRHSLSRVRVFHTHGLQRLLFKCAFIDEVQEKNIHLAALDLAIWNASR